MTLLFLLHQRDQQARSLASLDAEITRLGREYSLSRGYRVPLRREALRLELERERVEPTPIERFLESVA